MNKEVYLKFIMLSMYIYACFFKKMLDISATAYDYHVMQELPW